MERMPLVQARVLIFKEVLKLITSELCKSNTIEWEERIFFHTVMMNRTGLEKEIQNLTESHTSRLASTRVTTARATHISVV